MAKRAADTLPGAQVRINNTVLLLLQGSLRPPECFFSVHMWAGKAVVFGSETTQTRYTHLQPIYHTTASRVSRQTLFCLLVTLATRAGLVLRLPSGGQGGEGRGEYIVSELCRTNRRPSLHRTRFVRTSPGSFHQVGDILRWARFDLLQKEMGTGQASKRMHGITLRKLVWLPAACLRPPNPVSKGCTHFQLLAALAYSGQIKSKCRVNLGRWRVSMRYNCISALYAT